MSIEIIRRSCPTCEACCGLRVHVDREKQAIVRIDGDPDDFRSRGYLCPKSQAMKAVYEDPDRIKRPLRKRADGSFEEIGWDEAFAYAAQKLRLIREQYGPQAVGVFIGEPTGHNLGALLYTTLFMRALETPRAFSSATMDQFPKNVTLKLMYGDGWMFVIPDVKRTDLFICMGGNPVVSQGSLMGTPDVPGVLTAIRKRGGRVVVIDPRRTETAELADEHLFIRPGTDAYFLAAMIQVFFAEGLVDLGRFAEFTDGVEKVRALCQDFTPEAVAGVTGIDAGTTRRLAREYARTQKAALYGRIGTCTQEFGTLASWLLDVAAILTGHFDEEGCMMFPRPAAGQSEPGEPNPPMAIGPYRTIARGLPTIDGQLPAGAMAEEIEEKSAGGQRMRALLTAAANPVLSAPNGNRLAEALGELDFMVSVDIYLNETTSHADLILPTTVSVEEENFDFTYATTCSHNYARWSPAIFEPAPDAKPHWEVLMRLVEAATGVTLEQLDEAMVGGIAASVVHPGGRCEGRTVEELKAAIGDERGPLRILDLMLRAGPYGDRFQPGKPGLSLKGLRDVGGLVDLGPLKPRLPEALKTPGRRIDLAPDYVTADVPRLRAALADAKRADRLLLVGRRQVRNMNTWLHNAQVLAKGRERCTLLVHPDDARRFGLEHGGKARVRSRSGEIVTQVEVSDEMMQGTVSLPHGFGHTRPGSRTQIATKLQPGANANQLTDELPLDVPSGTHIANGIPVEVARA
ncbi:molybdopterin-dependent oxidoreductase [Myxococcota bacterium]|nr:molybdopterin-dependent oxidoreductase [Myxococcota bacterium]